MTLPKLSGSQLFFPMLLVNVKDVNVNVRIMANPMLNQPALLTMNDSISQL